MSKTIEISRELAERIANPDNTFPGFRNKNVSDKNDAIRELRALLNAPSVERQEPVAWAMQSGLERIAGSEHACHSVYGSIGQPGWDIPLYASPTAPIIEIELPTVCASDSPHELKRDIIEILESAGLKVKK